MTSISYVKWRPSLVTRLVLVLVSFETLIILAMMGVPGTLKFVMRVG